MEEYDFSNYKESPSQNNIKILIALSDMQLLAEADVENAEQNLKDANEKLRKLKENDIPELMLQLGLEEFSTSGGHKVKIEKIIHASIAEKNKTEAMKWLRDNKHENLIKRIISIPFAKGEDNKARKFIKDKLKGVSNFKDVSSVHHSTLKAFVKEKLQKGEDVPMELFGVYEHKVSKIL